LIPIENTSIEKFISIFFEIWWCDGPFALG
jgi:hypothetical protein